MFRHALSFDYCAQLLHNATPHCLKGLVARENLRAETAPEGTYIATVPIHLMHRLETIFPLGAMRAFATELYLKCLIVINKLPIPRTHELVELFNALPSEDRQRLNDLFDEQAAADEAFQIMQAELDKKISLAFSLREMNKTFETWRYAYESPFETSLVGHPWAAAGLRILELRPEFSAIAEGFGQPPSFP